MPLFYSNIGHKKMIGCIFIIALAFQFMVANAFAGPPFRTDDPEPVEYKHWEIYIASQGSFDQDVTTMTAPHFEVNYGMQPNVQVHILAPFGYVNPQDGPSHYGYGDTEIGVKVRFVQETESIPQVGIFPLYMLPTGDSDKQLGNGEAQAFLPLWVQKSWGTWTTYGGGGYGINSGDGNRNYWFFGWLLQCEISKRWSVGAEVFHQTASEVGGDPDTGFNIGTMFDLTEEQHLSLSAGRDFTGPNHASFYVGYQWTL